MEETSTGDSKGGRCLFCIEIVGDGGDKSKTANGFRKEKGSEGARDLKAHLSIFFMLKKVLGLSSEFVESLLVSCGSPVDWKIELCRHCKRLFKEAEYLWDRMCQLQRDYEKVTYEIKDTLINSMSTEEVENLGLVKVKRKDMAKKKLKSLKTTESVRATFFNDLQDQIDKDLPPVDPEIPLLSAAKVLREESRDPKKVIWSDNGMIPYLSLADFEKKMKDIVQMVTAAQDTSRSGEKKPLSPKPAELFASEKLLTEENDLNGKGNLKKSIPETYKEIAALLDSVDVEKPSPNPSIMEQEQEPLIRIVQTSTLMEPDEDTDDNDAIPHVLGVIKHDFDEVPVNLLDMEDESIDDPLAEREDDPDYIPDPNKIARVVCGPSASAISDVADAMEGVNKQQHQVKKPEKKRWPFSARKIKPVKRAPKIYACSKCSGTFEARLGCQIHIGRDHYGDSKPFICHVCNEYFSLHHALREHVKKEHECTVTPYDDDFSDDDDSDQTAITDKPLHTCPVEECLKPFLSKRKLQDHTKAAHGLQLSRLIKKATEKFDSDPPELELKCHICAERNIEYRPLSTDILEMHYAKVHSESGVDVRTRIIAKMSDRMKSGQAKPKFRVTTMKCPDCSKILPNSAKMAEHLKNPENKCPKCTKHFQLDLEMKQHLERDHYSTNNYQCPYCNKSFTVQMVFQKHIENHQIYDIHECEICHVKVTGFATLTRHVMHAHPEGCQPQGIPPNPEIFGL